LTEVLPPGVDYAIQIDSTRGILPGQDTVRKDRLQLFLDSVLVKCSAWPLGSEWIDFSD